MVQHCKGTTLTPLFNYLYFITHVDLRNLSTSSASNISCFTWSKLWIQDQLHHVLIQLRVRVYWTWILMQTANFVVSIFWINTNKQGTFCFCSLFILLSATFFKQVDKQRFFFFLTLKLIICLGTMHEIFKAFLRYCTIWFCKDCATIVAKTCCGNCKTSVNDNSTETLALNHLGHF